MARSQPLKLRLLSPQDLCTCWAHYLGFSAPPSYLRISSSSVTPPESPSGTCPGPSGSQRCVSPFGRSVPSYNFAFMPLTVLTAVSLADGEPWASVSWSACHAVSIQERAMDPTMEFNTSLLDVLFAEPFRSSRCRGRGVNGEPPSFPWPGASC